MSKINILPSEIYNKIAAGEVVENPASVVKELVENSIDSGANQITVEVEGGGIERISVADNGCGMTDTDLKNAFLPHATSKLSCINDLFDIKTLGFRGEALSSIASVSKITATSKTAEQETASRLILEGGKVVSQLPFSANYGTHIEVEDLFFNTPARKKFLRTPGREAGEISNIITRMILANPHIKFRYILDGKIIYDFSGTGVEEAIFVLYGKNCLDNVISVQSSVKDVMVTGYIGVPEYYKANTSAQTIVVNSRYVNCPVVASAIKNAYQPYLMTRQYPFYVLYINLPHNLSDVNVHPAKMEVKFSNSNDVYMAAYLAAKDALLRATRQYKDKISVQTEKNIAIESNTLFPPKTQRDYAQPLLAASVSTDNTESMEQKHQQTSFLSFERKENFNFNSFKSRIKEENTVKNEKPVYADLTEIPLNLNNETPHITEGVMQEYAKTMDSHQKQGIFSDAKFLGVVFDTYILLERGDFLFIIDQHAAHERILYDIYTEQYNNRAIDTQPMLIPYVFEATDAENSYIQSNLENLRRGGFDIEQFGHNAYKLSSIPTAFMGLNAEAFVKEVLANIRYFDMSSSELTRDMLARRACKAAVKAGDTLDRAQIHSLLQQLDEKENLRCPHGRPLVVVYSIVEFEKWFKRIV